jgi:glycosyltransferase involved in cell wall biosynthesis
MRYRNGLPLVTVVTPSYNQAEFLEHAICSVLGQDYPSIEYFLVDGASSDRSNDVIEKYASSLNWWVSEPDDGQADAINKGLRKANGEIIAWLNSDDLYLPGAVSSAVDVLLANPDLGLVYGDAITIDINGRLLNQLVFPQWTLEDLMAFRIICQPAVFMRREVLERAGTLNESFHFMLDHQLWLRIAAEAPIQHIPSLLAAARYHPTAKNVAQAEQFSRETYNVLAWMEKQPEMVEIIHRNRRKILAGAYRLSARYLLDGGFYKEALRTYGKALITQPVYAIGHWHRMLYALLCLFGGTGLDEWYYQMRRGQNIDLTTNSDLKGWVGLRFDG